MTIRTHTDEKRAQELKLVVLGHGVKKLTKDGTVQANPSEVIVGDARDKLKQMTTESVDCVITSPPYFRLRNYQHDAQIGLEAHVDSWVEELRGLMAELKRVLKPTGSLWLNLGDSFSRSIETGASPKSLLLAPERLALAMQRDGWILRNKVIWAKSNPMPTSVRDRLSCTWEVIYFFTRCEHYYFDLDAIRIPHLGMAKSPSAARAVRESSSTPMGRVPGKAWSVPKQWRGPLTGSNDGLDQLKASGLPGHPLGKNPGDLWTIPTAGYRGAHHAVYPERLIELPLLATCPERVCAECGEPWIRQPHRTVNHQAVLGEIRKVCACPSTETKPGIVLDPFLGSGTTAVVAERLNRDWLGIELNPEFAQLAKQRIDTARSQERIAQSSAASDASDDLSDAA